MKEHDIHRMEGALLGGLGALVANGVGSAVLLVVLVHALAFGVYGVYAGYTSENGPAVFGALAWLLGIGVGYRILRASGLPRKAVRFLMVPALLMVAVQFESSTGLLGQASVALTGRNAFTGLYGLTGYAVGPEAEAIKEKDDGIRICKARRGDPRNHNGDEFAILRTNQCKAYLEPNAVERACRAFADTRKPYTWSVLRDVCSTWIKGPALQPMAPVN